MYACVCVCVCVCVLFYVMQRLPQNQRMEVGRSHTMPAQPEILLSPPRPEVPTRPQHSSLPRSPSPLQISPVTQSSPLTSPATPPRSASPIVPPRMSDSVRYDDQSLITQQLVYVERIFLNNANTWKPKVLKNPGEIRALTLRHRFA